MSAPAQKRPGRPKNVDYSNREFIIKVLEFLHSSGSYEETRNKFGLSGRQLLKIVHQGIKAPDGPGRLGGIVGAHQENAVRHRLHEKAVKSVEAGLAPVEEIIENSELLSNDAELRWLPVTLFHTKNRALAGVKVLEGLGDFRKGGDDIPRDIPRQPLFHLPPGSDVAITVDIKTKGELNASSGKTIEGTVESVDAEVQDREPSSGNGNDSSL